jgi:hypoxanthine phosphoribosyltransferase
MLSLHLSYYNIIESYQVTGVLSALRFISILALFDRLLFNIGIRLGCLKSKINQERLMIVGKPLFTTRQIQTKVKELADRISEDYSGKDLLVVGILKGAFMFFSDVVRSVKVPLTLDFVIASSYVKTETSGEVKIYYDIREDISNKHVLLIDDIVDSGITLNQIRESVLARRPETLKICVFLDKKERRMVDVPLDYVGFEILNEFVVGYGLDYDGKFRNLPYISVFKKKA